MEAQSKVQFSADWDAETMQSMCRALPFLRELFLGTHADHPKPCRADPSCSPETRGSSGRLCHDEATQHMCHATGMTICNGLMQVQYITHWFFLVPSKHQY